MMNTFTEDWLEGRLVDVVRPDSPIGYGIVQPGLYVRDGVPVLAIRDMANPSVRNAHRSSQDIEAAYRRSRVAAGDVLISVKGTTGRIGLVPDGFVGNISRDVARVRLRPEHNPRYWFQLLQSTRAQQVLQLAAVGSTRQELSIGTLKILGFFYPSKPEQDRIAEVLSDVDRLIAALALTLSKKSAIKHGMARELLTGATRLPGYSQPWLECPLGDLATISKGQQLGRAQMDAQQTVPVWNGGVVPSGFTSSANVNRSVVTISEGGNSCGWVGRPGGPFWLGGHCYALDPRDAVRTVGFLYHALKHREPSIMALRVGSGLPNIQKKRLAGFAVDVPTDADEATAIARVLDDVDAELKVLASRLDKARLVKEGMMQELLSGQIRLPVVEAIS